MSLRSESKKFLHEDKEEMKEMDTVRRPLPRFQKDSTNCVSAGRERASSGGGGRAWPLLPLFAAVLCMGILGIHLLPPSKYTNFADPFTSFDPDQKVGNERNFPNPSPRCSKANSTYMDTLAIRKWSFI